MTISIDSWRNAISTGDYQQISAWIQGPPPEFFHELLILSITRHLDQMTALLLKLLPAWIAMNRAAEERKMTPLAGLKLESIWHQSLLAGCLPAAQALVAENCSIHEKLGGIETSEPPVLIVVRHDSSEMLRWLLDLGADPNAEGCRSGFDETYERMAPLHLAAQLGKMEFVELLLQRGADPNKTVRWESGTREMYLFSLKCPLEFVPSEAEPLAIFLLKHGARIQDQGRDQTLSFLVTKGFHQAVRFLVKSGGVSEAAMSQALHEALNSRNSNTVSQLLDLGASPEAVCDGVPALHRAAENKSVEGLEALIRSGTAITGRDSKGQTALHRVIHFDQLAVGFLSSVHPEASTSQGSRLQKFLKEQQSRLPLIRQLLTAGADLEAEDLKGRRPLHLAARQRAELLIELLLQAGADIQSIDGDGFSILHSALGADTSEIYGGLAESSPHKAIPADEDDLIARIISHLLEAGAPLASLDRCRKASPLHWAAAEGARKAVELLIKHGANPALKDGDGWTPRYWAIRKGFRELGKWLLSQESAMRER